MLDRVWDAPLIKLGVSHSKRIKDLVIEDLRIGAYLLLSHLFTNIPGKNVVIHYRVVNAGGDTLVHDMFRLRNTIKTHGVEFLVTPEDGRCSLFISMESHTILPIKLTATLLRRRLSELSLEGIESQREELYATFSLEDALRELRRSSMERDIALAEGMIRPFLLLASMHPVARLQIADFMQINLLKIANYGDAHCEAWQLINMNRKGIQAKTNHSFEKLLLFKSNADWFQCLQRSLRSVRYSKLITSNTVKGITTYETLAACKQPYNKLINDLEQDFIVALDSMINQSALKRDPYFSRRVDSLMNHPELQEVFQMLCKNGLTNPGVHRFAVSFCLAIYLQLHRDQKSTTKFQRKEVAHEQKHEREVSTSLQTTDTRVLPANLYDISDEDFVFAIKTQLLSGHWDPRSAVQKGAQSATSMGSSYLFTHLVLIPIIGFVPFLLIPIIIYRVFKALIGSNPKRVFVVSVQILLYRMVLAAHDIDINSFY